jgi:aryl-alcohol dehydrogenase-like predicted oxidoreductase
VAAPIASARTVDQLTSMMAFTRFELTAGQRSALDDVSARVPST